MKKFTVQMRIEGTLVFNDVEAYTAAEAMAKVDNEMMGDADLSKMEFDLIRPEWAETPGEAPVFWTQEMANEIYGGE
jgi:hypothetical protein